MSFFDEIYNQFGSMMSDEQKEELKNSGEQFYENIDIDSFAPKEASEENNQQFLNSMATEEKLLKIKYIQIKSALNSGLLKNELTNDELEVLEYFEK